MPCAMRVLWCLVAAGLAVKFNEDARSPEHLAQVQAKAELVRLREQVAIAEEQEADVQERLAASEERVAALRRKLRDLRKEPSLSFLQLASDSKTDSESELRETQEKLSKEEDRAEVTRLLLLDQKRRVASEKNKLELLQNLQKRMEATAKERQRVLVATHRLLDTPIFDNSYAAASPAREPAPSQEQSTQDREKHVALGRALENAKLARAQTEQLSALVAEQGDKLKEMKAKAAESQKEFEKLQKERQRLEDSLRRSKELRHSDATFAALKRLQEAQATLKEKEKELESAHQEIDKAKEHLEQKRAALKKEQERTQQLESQVAEADAKVEVLGKEEQKMEERRKELEDEKRTLQEVKRMDKEYEDLEVQAVQENVTLQTVQKQLMEEQQRTQELAERSRQQLEEEQQRAEAEASEAEEELAEAKMEEDAEFKGQEATLERKFKAEQAALQKQFEENEAATEEREKKKAFYALEPLREEIRAVEDMAKAHRKKIREDEEDAQTELKQLQDELAHETDAEKKRLAEHQYQVQRMQNKHLKIQRDTEAKLQKTDLQLKREQSEMPEQQRHLQEVQGQLAKAKDRLEKAERALAEEKAETRRRLDEVAKEAAKEDAQAARRLKEMKDKDEEAINVWKDKGPALAGQVDKEDRLDAEHRSLQEKQLETSRKAQILHGALEKDEEQLRKAEVYLSKEMDAANLAESKVKAMQLETKEKQKVEQAVSTWRSALQSALASVAHRVR
ncbi:unnamed protein product [Effrenium voratum]|uniref:Trichohyalin n=1 Tax=Effrenium voratum TaxID=2562239 RepID=A0AA36MNH9_9DINO|nr:unnamed protein product [Effrenium voratum]CAJ1430834.1 unnamed protein product [Effrenium voratum]